MKKLIISMLLLVVLSACNKLNLSPQDQYSQDIVWKNTTNLDSYIYGLYNGAYSLYAEILPAGSHATDGYSDLVKYTQTGADVRSHNRIQSGAIKIDPSTLGTYLSPWTDTYKAIKNCNEYLINVKKYGAGLNADELKIRTAEVRFLRAFLYHKLAVRHGGVVLRISEDQLDGPSEKNKSRATTQETWDFVISELEKAATDLPESWASGQLGRATKGAAYGLLARTALYAERWDLAIAAVTSVEALANKGIYSFVALADLFTKPVANNKELMMYYSYSKPNYINDWDAVVMPSGDVPGYGGGITPTSELADLYEIKVNGTWQKFNWSNLSQYNNDPYANRDPRFYSTVLYNGASWKGRTVDTYVGGKDGFVQFSTGQIDKFTSTGYYTRKFAEDVIKTISDGGTTNWIEMRYTEMLFIKSEAYARKNDFSNAYTYLNKVRTRVQVGLNGLTEKASWTLYLNDLQIERACELAFEGHRYWDLRRWDLAKTILVNHTHGVKITGVKGNFSYTSVVSDDYTPYYESRYNIFPIPQTETLNNLSIVQDDNWK
jgi:hypothetical protein